MKFELDSGKAGTICVCKTIHDDSAVEQTSNKRPADDEENSGVLKKLKADQDQASEQPVVSDTVSPQCEMLMEEIERLKKELSHRDQEISSLNKFIVALARKQVL